MAKSIRAKVKMAARRKKRADGFYAATEVARLERLHARLMGKGKGKAAVEGEEAKDDEDVPMETGESFLRYGRGTKLISDL